MRSAYNISFFLEDSAKASILDKHNSINKIGHAIHDLDLLFRKFSYRKEYKQILSDLGYKSPQIVQSMYIMKPPYIGGLVNPHQDNAFLITNPNSCIGIWVALEDSSEDNGAMFAVPQSHKLGTKKYWEKVEGKMVFSNDQSFETDNSVCLPAKAGTVILLHGDLVH